MENFAYDIFPVPSKLRPLPDEILNEGRKYLERLEQRADDESKIIFHSRPELLYVLSLSDFIAKTLIQYPKECAKLIAQGAIDDRYFSIDASDVINETIVDGLNDSELKKRLRILRRTRMVIIAWRDLIGLADIEEVFVSLSNLAEGIVIACINVIRNGLKKVFGDALDKDNKPMPLLVLGMGKLGGGELNFSSDIDLIMCYPYDGTTVGGSRQISHQEFFSKLVQRLANFLSDVTVDGFCYRLDLRLRPFGDAGALVSSFDALSNYYETQGRTWERYALVKAKLLGSFHQWHPYGEELIELLRPFVYRRYLDFGAIESLRKLKRMIEAEVQRRKLNDNFKLGKGGIREIEFIAQVFELMRGGRIPELAERSLRKTLVYLDKFMLLPSDVCKRLDAYYVYLRRLENIIQEFSDVQTQSLPTDEKTRLKLAYCMNRDSYEQLYDELSDIMSKVHEEFCKVIKDDVDHSDKTEDHSLMLWESSLTAEEFIDSLEPFMHNKDKSLDLAKSIVALREALSRLPIGPIGYQTLLRLMPKLIILVAKYDEPDKLFKLVANLIERICLRTTYLQLLNENDMARTRLVSLFYDSKFASELICAHPILLDELIAPRYFTTPPKSEEYFALLREQLMRVNPDDLEEQMEELRLFKKIMVLRIAMSDRAQSLPLMKISDCLSFLAEAIMQTVCYLAWDQTAKKLGTPPNCSKQDPGFAIIAYGKLGGLELGYKSDLDMVFIKKTEDHSDSEEDDSDEKHVSGAIFYPKLVQRMLHLCTTRMVGGCLYDLDMRLRPDGDSGLLISDTKGFYEYQDKRAWTWEHQALVRARPIFGSKDVVDEFNKIRDTILRKKRDEESLRKDVLYMRQKMRRHLDKSSPLLFDLKEGVGGMVDIEFIAQYLILKEAPNHKDMVLWSDNVRIFDECERLKILTVDEVRILKEAYLELRGLYHRLSLAEVPRLISIEDKPVICNDVVAIWNKLLVKLPQA